MKRQRVVDIGGISINCEYGGKGGPLDEVC